MKAIRVILSVVVSLTIASACCLAQQSISQTGLLPVNGIDVSIDPNWVDAAAFASASGTSAVFGQLWDGLKPCGFNTVRFAVDATSPEPAATRLANLCVWAKANNVYLLPILVGAETGKPLPDTYAQNAADTVRAFAKLIMSGDDKQLYMQILAFQLEDCANHAGLHDAMPADAASKLLLDAASQLRKAEQDALKDSGLDVTPILVNASLDFELVKAKAMAGATLTDTAYNTAYSSLKKFLSPIAASSDIDLICVEWFPGSISAGGADRIQGLLDGLKSDCPGKQLIFATGYSTGFNSADSRKRYITTAFANVADYRTREAGSGAFLGMIFCEAVSTAQAASAPPATDNWDWAAKSEELANLWLGVGAKSSPDGSTSSDMTAWLAAVEGNMGLFAEKTENGATTFAAQSGQETFAQIAGAVTDANAALAAAAPTTEPTTTDTSASTAPTTSSTQPPSTSTGAGESFVSGLGSALGNKVQEGLAGLLDKVFAKIGDKIAGAGSGSGSSDSGWSGYSDPYSSGGGSSSSSTQLAVGLSNVSLAPAALKVGDQVSCQLTLTNQSASSQAYGLTVAVVDGQGYALDNNAQQSGVSLDAGASKSVTFAWTAAAAGQTSGSVDVYDSAFTKLASAPVALDVSDSGGSPSSVSVTCSGTDVKFAPASPQANAPVKVAVSMHNTGSQDSAGLDVLLIDKDAAPADSLLAEVDGNVIPANNMESAQLDWTPQQPKTYNLAVQVWLGYNMLVAEADAPPVNVSGSGGGGGLKLVGIMPGLAGKLKVMSGSGSTKGLFGSFQNLMPLGLPLLKGFSLGSGETTPMSGKLPAGFSLGNPYSTVLSNISATLVMDGKQIETKSLGKLLPGQERSIVFAGLDAPSPGEHVFQLKLTGGSAAKPLSGAVKTRVTISSRAVSSLLGASKAMAAGVRTAPTLHVAGAAGGLKVRAMTPPTFKIGSQVVAARPAPPTLPGIKTTISPPSIKTRTIGRTTPSVSPTGPTRTVQTPPVTKPTIPGISAPPANVSRTSPPTVQTPPVKPPTIPGVSRPPSTVNRTGHIITIKQKPDLSISSSDINYTVARGAMVCTVTVHNLTAAEAKGAKVVCVMTADGGSPAQREAVVDVGANGTATARVSYPMPKAKQIKIEANVICSDDAVAGNNRASRTWSLGR